jgi:DivIVA domain-containing protein
MEGSARHIVEHEFPTSLRGYDRDRVRAFLGEVADRQSNLEERLAIAEAKERRAREELDSLTDVLERRLDEAKAARDTIIDEARREAAAIVEAAHHGVDSTDADAARTASAIVSEAETKAALRLRESEDRLADAYARAAEIVREANVTADLRLAEADRILDEARTTARSMRHDAERDRAEIEAQLDQMRGILAAAAGDGGEGLAEANVILTSGSDIIVDLRASESAAATTDA